MRSDDAEDREGLRFAGALMSATSFALSGSLCALGLLGVDVFLSIAAISLVGFALAFVGTDRPPSPPGTPRDLLH